MIRSTNLRGPAAMLILVLASPVSLQPRAQDQPAEQESMGQDRPGPKFDEAYFRAKSDRERKELLDYLGDQKVAAQLARLSEMPEEDIVSSFAAFHPYDFEGVALEARVPHRPSEAVKEALPPPIVAVVRAAFSSHANLLIDNAGQRLRPIASLSSAQRWTLLKNLEAWQEFAASAKLAAYMSSLEKDSSKKDLLALVEVRNRWFVQANNASGDDEQLERACASKDKTVAGQAQRWREAVSKPVSYEGAVLCHRIWQVLQHDQFRLQRAFGMTNVLASSLPSVIAGLRGAAAPDSVQAAELNAILCEQAYQLKDPQLLSTCAANAKQDKSGNKTLELMPDYFKAMMERYRDNYSGAANGFEELFQQADYGLFSMVCGLNAAECMRKDGRYVESLSLFQALEDVYTDNNRVKTESKNQSKLIKHLSPALDMSAVASYATQHYQKTVQRMSTQRDQGAEPVKIAMTLP